MTKLKKELSKYFELIENVEYSIPNYYEGSFEQLGTAFYPEDCVRLKFKFHTEVEILPEIAKVLK